MEFKHKKYIQVEICATGVYRISITLQFVQRGTSDYRSYLFAFIRALCVPEMCHLVVINSYCSHTFNVCAYAREREKENCVVNGESKCALTAPFFLLSIPSPVFLFSFPFRPLCSCIYLR